MVVDIELENHGYSEFDVNPYYFEAVVNKVQYACDAATFDTSINTLPLVTLQDGGAVSGQLVYQIAEGSTEYSIEYTGYTWMDYNFVKPQIKTVVEAHNYSAVEDCSEAGKGRS